ncbi:protein CROWDED NUCLEI 1-like isoform X2 [Tripterygium wilfordii]|uniref:protein CROWDED NUCLEI 1-like isoform X2 n=1 Tax=Tripterygium wilfordii TaxID=458696 RepID=UPI0018F85B2E|nr:protein CROWDED NUCLEI 1-like isoform X2 [Tripterygium wilfordii]
MLTPQKKMWSGWSPTPRRDAQKTGDSNSNGPSPSLNGVRPVETSFNREELLEKITKLENELFDYQYNMGLLLIEKKEWASKYEGLGQALAEATETVKREQASHLIAISDVEKREENLRKALGVEKQCVLDLEKALREMHSKNAEIKFTADSKLVEANALITSIEEKSLEVEAKLYNADAKLAEVSRKSSEIERKFQEVESRENVIRRERKSFIAEREVQETNLSKQREDLREWERKLQEGEERQSRLQRIISQREERANENDRIFKLRESDLEEAQKKINQTNASLKKKEEDISSRLTDLELKQKEYDSMKERLVVKERELLVLEEKLNAREGVEIQKLVDEHNALLDAKKREFDLELDQKRKTFDEDLKSKVVEVEKKEAEINHIEEKVSKREQALDKRLEKLREKELQYESKFKALEEMEKAIKSEENNLVTERKQIAADNEDLLRLKTEVEKIRADNEEQLMTIREENNRLKISVEERSEYLHLQSELKEEIKKCRVQEELLLKETEDLRQQKELFEREWEQLDEKRVEIEKELKSVIEQKEKFEKQTHYEEERLKSEKQLTQDYIKRELEALEAAKESFAASMEHDQSMMSEKVQCERNKFLHEFEILKTELETDLQHRREELEKQLHEKEKSFNEEKDRELGSINKLREVASREMEEMRLAKLKIEEETLKVAENQKLLEEQQLDMRKDIDKLVDLSEKLKDRREQFSKEKERFILFVEQHKSCKTCGELTSDFVLTDLQVFQEVENIEVPKVVNDYLNKGVHIDAAEAERQRSPKVDDLKSPTSGGTVSWLRKCTSKIFKFSPNKKIEPIALQNFNEEEPLSGERDNGEGPSNRLSKTQNEAEPSYVIANDSFDVQRISSDTSGRDADASQDLSVDHHSNNSKAPEVLADSHVPDLKRGRQPRRRGKPRVNRTHSVKAVVQDARAILGEAFDAEHQNGTAEDSGDLISESRGESSLADKGTTRNPRKRSHARTSQVTMSGQAGDDSEVQSDSVTAVQHKKRRQKVAEDVQTLGETRYNLRRRPRIGKTAPAARALSAVNKQNENVVEGIRDSDDGVITSKAAPVSLAGVASENGRSSRLCGKLEDDQGEAGKSKLAENMALSEEVNGTPERAGKFGGDEYRTDEDEDADNNDDDDDGGESQHVGEASIGKKLWTFLTT